MPDASHDHDTLALRLLDGDEAVVQDLIRAYGPKLRGVVHAQFGRLLADDEQEDAVTTAFLKAWNKRNTFDDKRGSLRAWLVRIAMNAAKDMLKGRGPRALQLEEPDAVVDGGECAPPSPEQEGLAARMEVFMSSLPPKQQAIARADLATPGGVADSASLAARLGCPRNSVRVQRHSYRQKLRQHFQDLESGSR